MNEQHYIENKGNLKTSKKHQINLLKEQLGNNSSSDNESPYFDQRPLSRKLSKKVHFDQKSEPK